MALACLATVAGTRSPLGCVLSEGLCFISPLLVVGRGRGLELYLSIGPLSVSELGEKRLLPGLEGYAPQGLAIHFHLVLSHLI